MKRPLSFFAVLLFITLAIPANARAAFTGQMEMALTMPNGTAEIMYLFGKKEQRMDMTMHLDRIPEPLETTVITRSSRPDEAIIVNHKAKSWSAVNLRTAAESATLLDFDSDYQFSRIGMETVKGYPCEHVRLQSSTEQLDLWISDGLANFSTFRLLQSQNPRLSNTSLSKTLEKNGADGFPVRIVQNNESGLYSMELVTVLPKQVTQSSFTIPKSYIQTDPDRVTLNSDQKKHLRQLMEKMKEFER